MIRSARTFATFCSTLLLIGLAGCGDDEDGGTGLPAAISLTLANSSLTIAQGASGTVGVTVGRQNGASGAIAVTVEGLPAGVTAPAVSIADGQTTGTLNITSSANAAVATTALTVRATAANVTAVTAPLSLVVTAAPGFSMSLNPTTVSIPSGNNTGTSNLTITRTGGFAGSIALTATGAPSGMTVSFNPASTTGTTSAVSVAITSAVAIGTHTLTVRGNATGLTERTATLTVTVAAASGVTMSLSPSTVPVAAGNSGTSTLTLTRIGGFAAAVALTATAASTPAGVTVGFNPASLTGSTVTSTVTVATTAAVAAGTYSITLNGDATGLTAPAATTLTLTVTAAAGGFTVSLNPTTQTLQQGQSANIAVTIARTGAFTGAVALAATGLPNGVTPSFNPASVTGTTSTLTLTATGTATTGPATVTVTGTGTGASNQTATVALTVSAGGGGGGGNVSVAFCPSTGAPVWVAFQDGTNAWVQATAVNGVYSGTVNSGRGGVAYVTPVTGGGFQTTIRYGSQAELGSFNQVFCSGLTGTGKTVNVTVAGVAQTDFAFMGLGSAVSFAFPGQPTQPFQNVPDGLLDLLGARGTISQTGVLTVNRLFAQRGITPAANSTVNVDFGGSNALDPVTGTLTVNGLGADQASVSTGYFSANGSFVPLVVDAAPSASTTRNLIGYPTVAGSFHFSQVLVTASDRTRAQSLFYSTVGAKTLTLSPDLGAPTVTAAATSPNLRLQAVIPSVAPYNTSWSVTYAQGTAAQTRRVVVQLTAAYVGSVGATVTSVVPDLGSSYQVTWGMTDASTTWTVNASAAVGFGATGQYLDGATITAAGRSGTYAPEQED